MRNSDEAPLDNIPLFLGLGKTDSVLAEVVDRVVATEESIAEDDERTSGRREIHAHEGGDAAARDLKDVVGGGKAVLGTSKVEGDVGQSSLLLAVNAVLATEALLGANLLVEHLGVGSGEDVEGSAGVEDGTSVLQLGSVVTDRDGQKVNLPVSLAAERDVLDLALVVGLVDTTEDDLALTLGVGQVEGEDGLVDELLLNHTVEGRHDVLNGNGVIAQTQNTVEAAEQEGQARLAGSLGEILVLDLKVADGDDIVGDETLQAARAVVDLEAGAVLLVGRGLLGVVRRVQEAGNAAALDGGNPEVGAAGVQDNVEGLGRGTDSDLREVCE